MDSTTEMLIIVNKKIQQLEDEGVVEWSKDGGKTFEQRRKLEAWGILKDHRDKLIKNQNSLT